MQMLKERKGFTLIELLMVVAIISIIAAVAIPTILSTRGAALESKAKANLRTLSFAQTDYFAKYGEFTSWATLVGGDADGGKYLDSRWTAPFTEDGTIYAETEVGNAAGYEGSATLPNGTVLTIDETGKIT
ncbi:MAG: hypothetical protein A2Y63_01830 [Candidatus Riflebacteria bacterium RBG_13_59_9]|nr:MAG: hypothetical protein A2Y63_01830 [Candidatus Riflebacteria bacterium RBG_13_59_9]